MRTLLPCFLLLALALPSHARWGDSYEKCEQRYGKPIKVTKDAVGLPGTAVFRIQKVTITVRFSAKVANKIIYSHPDGSALASKELFMILNAYSDPKHGLYFQSVGEPEDLAVSNPVETLRNSIVYQTWVWGRGKRPDPLVAIYNRKVHTLMISSKKTLFGDAVKKKPAAKKEKGF